MIKNLKRPICFIDIETTGIDLTEDRIVEITINKINVDGTEEIKTVVVNPEKEISEKATELHGFTNEDVKDKPVFKKYAKSLFEYIKDCDICGFKSNQFDIPILFYEFERCGLFWDTASINKIDVGNLFQINEPRTLTAAYKFYCDKELTNSHSSKADILATVEVFKSQIEKYNLDIENIEELAFKSNYDRSNLDVAGKFYKDENGDVIIGFGTHKGKKAIQEKSWLQWVAGDKSTFTKDVKAIAERLSKEQND